MNVDLLGILPALILSAGAFFLLMMPRTISHRILGLATISFFLAAFDQQLISTLKYPLTQFFFNGMVVEDRMGGAFQLIILAALVLVTITLMNYTGSRESARVDSSGHSQLRSHREIYALLLLAGVGAMMMVSAHHLAVLYIALELVSLLSYLLTGFLKKESTAVEGGLKYFLFGSLATGSMLYGISLIYGLTGTMDITDLAALFPMAFAKAPLLGGISLILLMVGLGFKISLVPFHMWAPDAYEGAATPVTTFFSLVPKLAGIAAFIRLFVVGFSPGIDIWPVVVMGLAVLTMTVGNVGALLQTNMKRLLAYSSIAHAGTMMIGVAVATPLGLAAVFYYLVAYLLMNSAAFIGVILVENATGREDIGAFSGLSQREPLAAFLITIAFLSLAGIPPLAGFFAKMWIFGAALQANRTGCAVVAALNSVISFFYYVKPIKAMYLDPVPSDAAVFSSRSSFFLFFTLGLAVVGLFVVGLVPGPWLSLTGALVPLQFGAAPWM